jgi:hypothetical protein
MMTRKLYVPMMPASDVASSHATRVLHAIPDADLHVGYSCRDILIAVVHSTGIEPQRPCGGVNQLKDTLRSPVLSSKTPIKGGIYYLQFAPSKERIYFNIENNDQFSLSASNSATMDETGIIWPSDKDKYL